MDPTSPAAKKMVSLLRYVDGDLDDDKTYEAMSQAAGPGQQGAVLHRGAGALFGRIAQGIATAGRADGARVMVEKPFGSDLASSEKLNETMHKYFAEDAIFRVDDWLAFDFSSSFWTLLVSCACWARRRSPRRPRRRSRRSAGHRRSTA
jgi:glucose-6-phosphate 1-dehydrogenase